MRYLKSFFYKLFMLKVLCPTCKNSMLYQPRIASSIGSKKCVYCGKSFKVYGKNTNRILNKIDMGPKIIL